MRTTNPATAYSYVRFSTPEQEQGDSIRRQVELRDNWLKKSGAVLDTALTMTDRGVSAYTGEHRKNPDRHALATFLKLVQAGRVERGSYLVVESLDRLPREHIRPALTLLLNLIDAGIRVVQLLPVEQVFGEDVEPMTLMMAIMELSRGHSESKMKSERLGRAWTNLRKKAAGGHRILSAKLPGWVRLVGGKDDGKRTDGGRLELIPARAEIVRRMVQLALDGHGVMTICQVLNKDRVKTFGRSEKWAVSTVYTILTSPALYGVFQPHTASGTNGKRVPAGDPIPGYYPPVIDETTYWKVQQRIKDRSGKGGKRAKHLNIFSGMLRDARDDGTIAYSHAKRRASHLIPVNAKHGIETSKWVAFPADLFERAVLSQLAEIDPADILPPGEGNDNVVMLSAKLADLDNRVQKLSVELETGDDIPAVVNAIRKLQGQRAELVEQLEAAKRESASPKSEAWGEIKTLVDALDSAPDPHDARVKLRAALRRVAEWVYCFFVAPGKKGKRAAFVEVQFYDGVYRQYVITYRPSGANASAKRSEEWGVESWRDSDEIQVTGNTICDRKFRAGIEADLLRRLDGKAKKVNRAGGITPDEAIVNYLSGEYRAASR